MLSNVDPQCVVNRPATLQILRAYGPLGIRHAPAYDTTTYAPAPAEVQHPAAQPGGARLRHTPTTEQHPLFAGRATEDVVTTVAYPEPAATVPSRPPRA